MVVVRPSPQTGADNEYDIYQAFSSYQGLWVCHTGIATGSSCGTVDKLGASVTYTDGTTLTGMTRVQGVCGNLGDSGGPYYRDGAAYGIHSGGVIGSCGTHYYTDVVAAGNKLNVRVATAG